MARSTSFGQIFMTTKRNLASITPLLLACLHGSDSGATGIFECTNPQGHRIFTHHDCPRSHPDRDLYNPEDASVYTSPTLSAEELDTLAGIERRITKPLRRIDKPTLSSTQHTCARVQQALRAIRAQKRKGYALADASRLDAHEARLKSERNSACY